MENHVQLLHVTEENAIEFESVIHNYNRAHNSNIILFTIEKGSANGFWFELSYKNTKDLIILFNMVGLAGMRYPL